MANKLSIVIPVYNSASILPDLMLRLKTAIEACCPLDSAECILVNDGSRDKSWTVIQDLTKQYGFIRAVDLRRNFGQHNAIMAGLNQVTGEIAILMDDDLQHPPEAISKMLDALLEGHDVCYTHYLNRQHAWWKKAGSWFNDRLAARILGKPKGLYLSSFKAIRRAVVDEIIRYDGPFPYVDGLILDVTQSITTIEIEHANRAHGKGNYTLKRSISLCMGMITSFSIAPLRIVSLFGFSLALASLAAILLIIVRKWTNNDWPAGWASIVATILFLGGVQLLGIGMIGEYLGRIYLKLNGKPQFIISKRISQKESNG